MLRIVYIDDEEELCLMFGEYFRGLGYEVVTFQHPEQGLNYVQNHPVDIVFLDYRMPLTTGDQLALKMDPQLRKVLVTGDLEVKVEAVYAQRFPKPIPWAEVEKFLKLAPHCAPETDHES